MCTCVCGSEYPLLLEPGGLFKLLAQLLQCLFLLNLVYNEEAIHLGLHSLFVVSQLL